MQFKESIHYDLNDIAEQPAVKALKKLYSANHFPHAILLTSNDISLADEVVTIFANKILNCDSCHGHMDFFSISPNGVSSQITTDEIHELMINIQSSPKIAKSKVAYIAYADTMSKHAANSFLKTLEEPPGNTTIFLSTTNKYSILSTIFSRCLTFQLKSSCKISLEKLEKLSNLYESWLNMMSSNENRNIAVLEMYRLLHYIELNIDLISEEAQLSKAEVTNHIIGMMERIMASVFKKDPSITLKLHEVTCIFEQGKYFLSLNCNAVSYFERCFIFLVQFFDKNKKDKP